MNADPPAARQQAIPGRDAAAHSGRRPARKRPVAPSAADATPPSIDQPRGERPGLPSPLRQEKRAEQRGSAQAQRTRAELLAAARRVFERVGYLDARVADIAAETGSSHGTFYTYFSSKDDIFRAVMEEALDTVYAYGLGQGTPKRRSERERIEASNQRFITVYRKNAAVMGLFEQVATYDLEFRKVRLAIRARWVSRIEHSLISLQARDLCRQDMDPHTVAGALASMVSNQVYLWQVMGEEHEEEVLLNTLNSLWIAAIGLVDGA